MSKRKSLCLWAILILIANSVVSLPAESQESKAAKRALLIAVSKYYRDSVNDLDDLNSLPDVTRLKAVLEKKFGFNEITVLSEPDETTHTGIRNAFKKLIDSTKPGDIVYAHFSGHGSEVPDPTKHKLSGMSQTIVPTDYDFSEEPLCNEITDLEMKQWVNELAAKGPSIATLSFDCCHSGGNTRGINKCRGFDYRGKLPGNKARGEASRTTEPIMTSTSNNIVVLAACRPNQKAWEMKSDGVSMGLFSYALTKAFMDANAATTYSDIIEQAKALMAPEQSDEVQAPQCDGKVENKLMSGIAIPKPQAIAIKRLDGKLLLEAGQLQDITKGSKFSVYPIDAKDLKSASPLGKVQVESVNLLDAEVLVIDDPKGEIAKLSRGKTTEFEHAYQSNNKLKVVIAELSDSTKNIFEKGLGDSQAFSVVDPKADDWHVKITKSIDGKNVSVIRDNGFEIFTGPVLSADAVYPIRSQLESEARWRFLKKLKNLSTTSSIAVEARIVPVKVVEKDANGAPSKVEPATPAESNSTSRLVENQTFAIEVKNNGSSTAFINVLDLTPSGDVAILYPSKDIKVDFPLPVDKDWHRIPLPYVFEATRPFGTDIIKVIATDKPTDFSPLANIKLGTRELPRGEDELNPIEKLFLLASDGTRAARPVFVPPQSWGAFEVVCEIKER